MTRRILHLPRAKIWIGIVMCLMLGLTGCTMGSDGAPGPEATEGGKAEVVRYTGEMSPGYPYVYTGKKLLSLTFNGLGDSGTVGRLLDELDKYGIKATFFVPGMRVAEEPEIAREIVARGHELENNTLNQLDLSHADYSLIYKEIELSNQVILRETGVQPRFVRTRSGEYTEDIRLAAAHLGMEAVVGVTINPKDRDMKDAAAIGGYVAQHISRGGIIMLNTEINPEVVASIRLIAEAAGEIGYKLVTLSELIASGGQRKPLEQIPGYDASTINADYQNAQYELYYSSSSSKKQISLTFDDWGTDKTVTQILDMLAEYKVPSTFFLRVNGVEKNPNLARAIVDEGHEVANHTYTHPVVTNLSPEDLQQEVVKAHQGLTYAIQEKPTMMFRPPTGEIDDISAKAVAAAGYPLIAMYDVTALDWDTSVSAQQIIDIMMEKTQPGSVLLLHMHDGLHTLEALPTIIEQLRGKGYEFVKMSELVWSAG